ncbi:MAG: hypothetical protein F4147_03685 [Gammaproteobacteria bacterium]|nr:hypothetical protein [Gammaproteobacteria bacterium]
MLAAAFAFALTSFVPQYSYSQNALEEIVVAARKCKEKLQDMPLTVSAFTKSALEERGIASLQDIADPTPGFAVPLGHHERDGEYDNQFPGSPPGTTATDKKAGVEKTDSITAALILDPNNRVSLQAHFTYNGIFILIS